MEIGSALFERHSTSLLGYWKEGARALLSKQSATVVEESESWRFVSIMSGAELERRLRS